MTKDNWTQLASAVENLWQSGGSGDTAANSRSVNAPGTSADSVPADILTTLAFSTGASGSSVDDIEQIARSAADTAAAVRDRREENVRPSKAQGNSGSRQTSGDSTAEAVLKTAGMVTGVGPLVTGLLKLFGGSDDKPEPPPLIPYSAPESISVDAGLSSDRGLVSIAYGQNGLARNVASSSSTPAATQIHVSVQAMDSKSFMDHSDQIAQAVRNAMLRSHALNDVVSEL